jgi:uncharacterized protein YkwD
MKLLAALLVGASAVKGGYVEPPQAALSAEAAAMLQAINAYRAAGASCGGVAMPPAPPLAWDEALVRAAEVQARHMASIADVTHRGSDGSSVGQRVAAQGYAWRTTGENVAAGLDGMHATLAQWMASPGHCRNMMNPQFRDVAVARQDRLASTYRYYWAMVLGAKKL